AGTIELYGSENAGIQMSAGSINNLIINKTGSKTVTLSGNATVNGLLTVESGALKATNKILTTGGNIAINNGGILWMDLNSQLKIGTSKVLTVNSGGTIRVEGSSGNEAVVTRSGAIGNYVINVTNGGTIAAQHATFYYIDPLIVRAGATIAEPNPFSYCKFRYSSNVGMLRIDNSQDLTIHNVEFLQPATGFNVSKSVDNGSLQFIDFYGDFAGSAFENDPYNRIFWGDEFATHNISIPAGWSGISSFVIPNQPAMEAVFAPISSELIIAQTMTQIYYPGENINTIGNWVSQLAYKVKTSATCTLPVIGEYETDMTVSLNAGWSLLPVVSLVGADASDLLIPANGFVIAKDVAGTGVFWPQYGINTIGTLLPGKAYFVLMTAPGVVDYTGMKSSGNHTGLQDLSGLEGFGIQPTPSTHTIAILPEALKVFDQGTIIGAYDQNGNCFGATVYHSETISLTVFGDDPTTAGKDGFFEGEIIFFKTLTGFKTLSGLTPTYDNSLPQFDGLFTENGLSAIKGFESSTGVEFNDFSSLVNIFPNPSDGAVNITGLQSGAKISVTDVHGQRVLIESCLSDDLKTIDLTSFNPGIYFIKIQQNGETIFRKVVLK
ncbi:MAG: T9SS type A sorting domain-containing protein, partial [Clostridia bacterium]|nr:T9SS type A sorting domain-containing protein [Clostridia bacterium]